jgi:hypothetical protein
MPHLADVSVIAVTYSVVIALCNAAEEPESERERAVGNMHIYNSSGAHSGSTHHGYSHTRIMTAATQAPCQESHRRDVQHTSLQH